MAKTATTTRHKTRLARRLEDPEFRAEYRRARAEIQQIDNVIQALDHLREEAGFSKADLARLIGKDPASIRRLFTAASNPELKTIAALANALGARIQVVGEPTHKGGTSRSRGKIR